VACTRSWLLLAFKVGLPQRPVREKRPKGACVQPTIPSLVPMPAQTAAKMRSSPPKALECSAETDPALEGDGFEPSVPREGVKGPSPQFHADYPPIGWAHKQRMNRMLNGFKRDGITCPAQTRCQPDRLI